MSERNVCRYNQSIVECLSGICVAIDVEKVVSAG